MSDSDAQIVIDTELWPLLVIIVPARLEVSDVQTLIDRVDAIYAKRERFATLVDTSNLVSLPRPAVRHTLADWQNSTIGFIHRYNVVTATAIQHALVRGAMTAMHWVFRPPNEQVAVRTFEEGLEVCCDRLRAAGVPLSAGLQDATTRKPRSYLELRGLPPPTALPR